MKNAFLALLFCLIICYMCYNVASKEAAANPATIYQITQYKESMRTNDEKWTTYRYNICYGFLSFRDIENGEDITISGNIKITKQK